MNESFWIKIVFNSNKYYNKIFNVHNKKSLLSNNEIVDLVNPITECKRFFKYTGSERNLVYEEININDYLKQTEF